MKDPNDTTQLYREARRLEKNARSAYRSKKLAAAKKARAKLTSKQVRDELTLDPEALQVLHAMSRGKAPRNAQSILGAIRLRLDFTEEKPKEKLEHSGGLNVTVQTLALPGASNAAGATARPPVVRKPEEPVPPTEPKVEEP